MPGTIGPRLHRRPASASLRPLPLFTMLRSAPPPLLAERHTRRPALRCIHHIAVATVIVTRFDDHNFTSTGTCASVVYIRLELSLG